MTSEWYHVQVDRLYLVQADSYAVAEDIAAAGGGQLLQQEVSSQLAHDCYDERHDTPCPQPCTACKEECSEQ